MYDNTFEENQLITLSFGNNVKKKISEKYEFDIEEFIEKEFPQDKELEVYFFKYRRKDDVVLALKINGSDYMLLLERSIDRHTNYNDNYMFCFDIQKRPEFIHDESNEFILKSCEIKIPLEFNRKYYNNSTVELLDDIEKRFDDIKPYKIPSLAENDEFKKWYAYLTLLEKLIDTKDFYFEAEIAYTEKKAKIDISFIEDKVLSEKIKKARNQSFLYYESNDVDTSKPLHEWDEKENKNRNFGELKENKNNELIFNLNDEFIKKFKGDKNSNDKIISSSYDTNDFIIKSRQYIEKSIKDINQNIVYTNNQKIKINITNSIKNLQISTNEQNKLIDVWKKLSAKNHDTEADDIDKNYTNEVLSILKGLFPSKQNCKSFNPPLKLILRVSYFRDQFQLKTLKRGLEQIQRHPLKAYLFGNKKIVKIDDDELENFEIEYLSQVLNEKQKEAIKKALITNNIFMIQGPPGTGKTEVISEIAYQEAIRGKKVLITSQANMAVDNALQRLNHPSLYPVRIIRKDYEPEDGNSLPVEANIGNFYQDRIIGNLSKELKVEEEELKRLERFIDSKEYDDGFIHILSKVKIEIPSSLDLTDENDRDDFKRILSNRKNIKLLKERVEELKEKAYFKEIQNDFLEELKDEEKQEIEEEKNYLTSNYMKNVNIWGATLFETGKYSFKDLHFDVVIVDEVSKAMPPELVLPILKAEKLILVGDHKQLPPIVKDVSLEDLAHETGISLDSLDFETTVFEKLIINNPQSYVMLNKQYRMHPHIQMAINQFYVNDENKSGLECGLVNPDMEKCHQIKDKSFKNKHLIWLKTKTDDREQKDGTSFKNQVEINGIEKTLDFLNRSYEKIDKKPTIGVITFYGKQLGELSRLEKRGFWNLPIEKRNYPNLDLRFGTVDRFQGQEKDIIIVSLVRNNKNHNVGFAKKAHRVNVAFSRAKKLLIIVGNVDNFTFSSDEKSSKQYRKIFNIAKKFGTVQVV
jgi:superfamily I DNA and/or RNA helicase